MFIAYQRVSASIRLYGKQNLASDSEGASVGAGTSLSEPEFRKILSISPGKFNHTNFSRIILISLFVRWILFIYFFVFEIDPFK